MSAYNYGPPNGEPGFSQPLGGKFLTLFLSDLFIRSFIFRLIPKDAFKVFSFLCSMCVFSIKFYISISNFTLLS